MPTLRAATFLTGRKSVFSNGERHFDSISAVTCKSLTARARRHCEDSNDSGTLAPLDQGPLALTRRCSQDGYAHFIPAFASAAMTRKPPASITLMADAAGDNSVPGKATSHLMRWLPAMRTNVSLSAAWVSSANVVRLSASCSSESPDCITRKREPGRKEARSLRPTKDALSSLSGVATTSPGSALSRM